MVQLSTGCVSDACGAAVVIDNVAVSLNGADAFYLANCVVTCTVLSLVRSASVT